ncbi:glycosyltransferase family 58 protein, partial [Atractiella rhizophila]
MATAEQTKARESEATSFSIMPSKLFHFVLRFPSDYAVAWSIFLGLFEVLLNGIIIRYVPYTEIDWSTYMQQVALFLAGERDYSQIKGDTGPLVYPAGFLRIYSELFSLTDGGKSIRTGQIVFGGLYVANLLVVHAILRRCKVPPWTFPLLSLSKRLHSIYVLRLFNDPVAMFFLYGSVLACMDGMWSLSSSLFSLALSIKMNILLLLPGYGLVLLLSLGLLPALNHAILMGAFQFVIGLPFLTTHPRSYLTNAFQFSRIFLYKWTVNWRFLPEHIFLDRRFATALLVGHLTTLCYFAHFKWLAAHGGIFSVLRRAMRRPGSPVAMKTLTARDKASIIFTSNLIGIVFARSLHYQFYSWYAHQVLFLTSLLRFPTFSNNQIVNESLGWAIRLTICAAIEYAWNVFPSTTTSSLVLLISHISLLFGIGVQHNIITKPTTAVTAEQDIPTEQN